MTDKSWKRAERIIAKRLGGQRLGPTGRHGADVTSNLFSIECKTRKRLPAWLFGALGQACSGAAGRLPIVILHQLGQRHDDDLALMRLADLESWLGAITSQEEGA